MRTAVPYVKAQVEIERAPKRLISVTGPLAAEGHQMLGVAGVEAHAQETVLVGGL